LAAALDEGVGVVGCGLYFPDRGGSLLSASPRFSNTWASVLLDLLRAIAAFVVLGEHWRNFFFVDFSALSATHRLIYAVPYALTDIGHQAVVIFFLLSGLLISGSVFRALNLNRWTWRGYATHRLVRLWIVLLPGLVLCAMWDGLGVSLPATRALYFGDAGNRMMHNVAYQRLPGYFLGNLFFLQGLTVPTFGSDTALWSLANEFWYYVLFPLVVIALWKGQRFAGRVCCALLFVVIAFWLRFTLLPSFPIWLAGALVLKLPALPNSARMRWVAALLYVPIVVALALIGRHLDILLTDYLVTIATAALLWVLLSARSVAPANWIVRAIRFLARGSFSLYIAHMPILAFAAAYLVGNSRWQPSPFHVLAASTVLAFTLIYAFVIAYFTEFRTDRVREWIELNLPAVTGQRRAVQ
jgi:peptidoglycan/LPS O-acetylase OafA/YrhL